MKFNMGGKEYYYAKFEKNSVYNTERTIELPVIEREVRRHRSILEVGNVLKGYYPFMNHVVVDKYDKTYNVYNKDILNFECSKRFDLVVSISTVEHIGLDEPELWPEKCLLAIDKIQKLGVNSIITFPLGYNKFLDSNLEEIKAKKKYLMKRISENNIWFEVPFDIDEEKRYNYPFPYGNWVVFLVD